MPPERSTVGGIIREQRAARHLTQRELAKLADIEHTKLLRIEMGRIPHPDPVLLGRIANVMGTSVALYYVAIGYPLPFGDIYMVDPRDFFTRHYGLDGADPKNLPEIEHRVDGHYRLWLEHLGRFTQEEINAELEQGVSNWPNPWPLSRGEQALFQLIRLRQLLKSPSHTPSDQPR